MSNAVLSEQGELFAKPKGSLPPMLAQYQDYKSEYPDCIIFYQVGDFYEVFFEDAVKTARILNITLTTRDKSNTDAVPMCGVPQASVDTYLERLVDQGHSVALVSQINSATSAVMPTLLRDEQGLTKTTGKVAIQRRLTRIVTPGVRILGQGSASPAASLVVAIGFEGETPAALCWCDPQSGKVHALEDLTEDELARQLETLEPKEIIAPKRLSERSLDFRNTLLRRLRQALPAAIFKFRGSARRRAGSLRDLSLIPGYSGRSSGCKFGLQLLIDYLDETVCGEQLPILEIGQAASHS
ncbi:MAG: hypothetical protein DCC75_12865, partial [Proteobacteria bacterium]